jgi:hypothetical protein
MAIDLSRCLRRALVCSVAVAAAGGAWAQSERQDGCTDATGRPVQEVDDPLLPVIVRAGRDGGAPVLRVNSAIMPGLAPRLRLFFHAGECARHALGQPVGAIPTPDQARRADCWALEVLRRSGELDAPGSLQAFQSELAFTAEQWKLLPGPPREIELAACRDRGVLRLPLDADASPLQQSSNRCIHGCGDRLWQCQKACTQAACRQSCEAAFDACQARCPAR